MKVRILPKTHSTTEPERGEKCSYFFVTCDALHLTCFDELSRKKKSPSFASVENTLYVLRSISSLQKKKLTEISNLGSLFIFKVFEQFQLESFRAGIVYVIQYAVQYPSCWPLGCTTK